MGTNIKISTIVYILIRSIFKQYFDNNHIIAQYLVVYMFTFMDKQ